MKTTNRVAWSGMGTSRVLLTIALVGACGDDGAATPDASTPDVMTMPDAPACGAGTFPWVTEFRKDEKTGPTIAGVHACVITHPSIPCVDTSITGTASFCVPTNSEIAISAQRSGLMPTIIPFVTGTSQPNDTRARILDLHDPACTFWSSGGAACPPSVSDAGGLLRIAMRVNTPGVEYSGVTPVGYPGPLGDVQVELMPPPGVDVFYVVNGVKDPNLTATHPASGNAAAGDVTEGDAQIVKLTHLGGQTCGAFSYNAWPGEPGTQTIRVPIRRGFRTLATATCE